MKAEEPWPNGNHDTAAPGDVDVSDTRERDPSATTIESKGEKTDTVNSIRDGTALDTKIGSWATTVAELAFDELEYDTNAVKANWVRST
jgi:hypothetical protein